MIGIGRRMLGRRRRAHLALLASVALLPRVVAAADCGNNSFSSTFALIQKRIFEDHGCTNSLCHGGAAAGGMDLRPEAAYANLIDVPAATVDGFRRVVPGRRDLSLLFVNLAAKTSPADYHAPLRAMPPDPQPALRAEELEAVRAWIEAGAPETGVVDGTDRLLDGCLPAPEPIQIKPLPPPEPGTGVQIRMPRYVLAAHTEREVCFASYYDLTAPGQVPAPFRGPGGDTFRYSRNEVRQDPLSHHLIVNLYPGDYPPDDPSWGEFRCRGGERDGILCRPTDQSFCGSGLCATEPLASVGCLGFGPPDTGLNLASSGFSGAQETAADFTFPPGVYRDLPLKGMIIWNSHAFNLTDQPGKLEAWLNFEFAPPEEQQFPARRIFDTNQLFKMRVPAFSTREVCTRYVLPRHARLFELSSHGHKRMKRWRTFVGDFRCRGGAHDGDACQPLGYDFDSPDLCSGAPCTATARQKTGDCDLDEVVAVNEVVAAVNVALGEQPLPVCGDADIDGDRKVSVDEIVRAVGAALGGIPPRVGLDPRAALEYVSLVYNDPLVLRYDEPLTFDSVNGSDRTLTYCALYDNGFTDPTTVKRRSTSPPPPAPLPNVGGPCARPTNCTAGKVGAPCAGATDAARDASCNSAGQQDGKCDACTLTGGVTTEDEMFLLLGVYYLP